MLRFLIALDIFVNSVVLEDIYFGETISARSWRCKERAPWKFLIVLLDKIFGAGHCESAFKSEKTYIPEEEK